MNNQVASVNIASLIRNNARYWASEYLVAKHYFTSNLRRKETDAKWLGFQMFKEWTGSGVYGQQGITVAQLVGDVARKIAKISETPRLAELESLEHQLCFASDEFRHFKDLARAYYHVAPESCLTLTALGDLPEGHKLAEMRYMLRTTPLGQAAVDLSEGGGLGLYFGICAVFTEQKPESELEKLVLIIGRNTLADEMSHMAHRYSTAYNAGYSDTEWIELDDMLQQICWQKLLERNEQFSQPFSENELKSQTTSFEAADKFISKYLSFLLRRLHLDPRNFATSVQ